MTSHSLRLRLLLGAAAWIAVALVLAGAVIVIIFAGSVERDRTEDLRANLDRLLAGVSDDGALSQIDPGLRDPRYDTPAGGLYWQVLDLTSGESARSRSLWDASIPVQASDTGEAALSVLPGPSGQRLDALTQDVTLPGDGAVRRLRVTVAEDSAIRGRDVRSFTLDIGVALAALGAALVLAGWLTVHLGLKPLVGLRRDLEAVTGGRMARLEGAEYPQEVWPLVDEVNALLAGSERSIAFARTRADDLAHALKTPLAVLSATTGKLRAQGDIANAQVLEMLCEEMAQRIDYQLRLAQLRVRSGEHMLSAPLDHALLRSVSVLRKTGRGGELFWKVDSDRVTADMDPHDLMELVGVLLENAVKWADSEVRVACKADGDMAMFQISDDGPGMTDAQIASLGQRGKRLDQERSGTGFGIAIAREIVNLNKGVLSLGRAETGGLSVTVRIPAAPGPLASPSASA